jgi:hypothetical protein
MRAPKTITLLLLSVCLFGAAPLLLRPVDVLREVRTQAGEVVRGPAIDIKASLPSGGAICGEAGSELNC